LDVSFWVAFTGGLLTFFSPCILPLVPVYLASLTGPEIFEPAPGKWRFIIFFHALSFVIGFAVVFTLFGAVLGMAGFALSQHVVLMRMISGILLILFGLLLLLSLRVSWLNFERRLKPNQGKNSSLVRSLLTGGIFAVAWTPCVGPVLGGILMLAMDSQTAYQGASLLAVYSLGLGLPFIVIGAAFDSLTPLLKRIRRFSGIFYIVSALLLIAIGILILIDKLSL
jgi:cytochrome c-type biogenesis protein